MPCVLSLVLSLSVPAEVGFSQGRVEISQDCEAMSTFGSGIYSHCCLCWNFPPHPSTEDEFGLMCMLACRLLVYRVDGGGAGDALKG